MQDQIIYEIHRIMRDHLSIDTTYIFGGSHLEAEVGMDSLEKLELVQEVEKHFNVSRLTDDIKSMHTVRDIAVHVEAKLGHK